MERNRLIGIIIFIILFLSLSHYADFTTNKSKNENLYTSYQGVIIRIEERKRGYHNLYLNNGQIFYSNIVRSFQDDLEIGDSISKPINSDSLFHFKYYDNVKRYLIKNKRKMY